jgi:predicted RNA binding protein YcfA (HicA-like mRNA interferase family)
MEAMQAKRFHKKLKKLGFGSPEPGGRHFYMRHGTYTLTLPSNKEYSVPQIKMLINEIEHGIGNKISTEVWEHL